MSTDTKQRRKRRSFTAEVKAEAVRLVLAEGKTVGQVARDLDLTETALRTWAERARADRGQGKPGALTTAERKELARLRKENRQLHVGVHEEARKFGPGRRTGSASPPPRRPAQRFGFCLRATARSSAALRR